MFYESNYNVCDISHVLWMINNFNVMCFETTVLHACFSFACFNRSYFRENFFHNSFSHYSFNNVLKEFRNLVIITIFFFQSYHHNHFFNVCLCIQIKLFCKVEI